jgi:hypothetical protein
MIPKQLLVNVVIVCLFGVSVAEAASVEDERAVLDAVLRYHFRVTQPFFRKHAIVADSTRANRAEDGLWIIPSKTNPSDPALFDALKQSNPAPISLVTPADAYYRVVDLSSFEANHSYDWRRVANEVPSAPVCFEVSRPVFLDDDHAAVRMQATKLRGSYAGQSYTMLLVAARQPDGTWVHDDFLSPCCFTPRQ